MLPLRLEKDASQHLRILCLGSHADDIEIGCGATLLKLFSTYREITVMWVVFGAGGPRAKEAQASATSFLKQVKQCDIVVESFRDGYFPDKHGELKEYFENRLKPFEPDLIFTHCRGDRHQDHRIVSDLTWNTFRNHLILEYEIPKYDGDLSQPNLFVEISEDLCRQKISIIMENFGSQSSKHWFTDDTFWAVLRLRGIECAASTKYAEAFHARKVMLN